jgi:hypothetical protein
MGLLEVDVKYHLIIFKVKYVDLIILDITLPVVASSFHKYYLHEMKKYGQASNLASFHIWLQLSIQMTLHPSDFYVENIFDRGNYLSV